MHSKTLWNKLADEYISSMGNDYHKYRLQTLLSMFPIDLLVKNTRILDFGCGNAFYFPFFLKKNVNIIGIDASGKMISNGKKLLTRHGFNQDILYEGSVRYLEKIKNASLDAVICFNTMAYFTCKEEDEFYYHILRIIKRGGYFLVSHSNELFDLFSMNSKTADFFKNNFIEKKYHKKIDALHFRKSRAEKYNVRENPLSYKYKLEKYNFKETRQEFINYHGLPPIFLEKNKTKNCSFTKEEKWKMLFKCSTFASLSTKE